MLLREAGALRVRRDPLPPAQEHDGAGGAYEVAEAIVSGHLGAMFDRLFRAHPRSVGESYGEHMRVAGRVGWLLIGGGIAALIHAVFPRYHQTTGSSLIRRLAAELDGRRAGPPGVDD